MRLVSGRVRTSAGSTATSAAKVTGSWYCSTQSCSSVLGPAVPARALAQVVGTSPPIGVVAPRPVMTRRDMVSFSCTVGVQLEAGARAAWGEPRGALAACVFKA